ncbi:bacteriorhodopsin [Sphingomonas aurantiaca]
MSVRLLSTALRDKPMNFAPAWTHKRYNPCYAIWVGIGSPLVLGIPHGSDCLPTWVHNHVAGFAGDLCDGKKSHPSGHHTLLHASVPFIAATAYLAMAFGIGTLFKLDGSVTYLARYLDWSVTTPILLSSLVLLAFHEHGRTGEVGGHLTAIIVLDVLMIATDWCRR